MAVRINLTFRNRILYNINYNLKKQCLLIASSSHPIKLITIICIGADHLKVVLIIFYQNTRFIIIH